MIQRIINALSANTELVGFVALTVFLVLTAIFWWPQRWWISFETRRIRPIAERRELFLKWTVVLLVIGFLSAIYHFTNPTTELGRLAFDLAALFMAAIGFFFAIYGIRGVLERPRNLDEVLIRTTEFIKKYEEKKSYTVVMLCEYPAWGALSRQRTDEYVQFSNALKHFLDAGTNRKLILVAPNDDQMKKRIGQYAKDYGRTTDESAAAQNTNANLVNTLRELGNEVPNGFRRWTIEQAPRYQMLMVGEQTSGERGLRLLEAIVWFAPRCSDIISEETSRAENTETQREERKINVGEEVPILAWHTTARDALDELYDSAVFYAKFYATGTKPKDYKEFLSTSSAKPPPPAK